MEESRSGRKRVLIGCVAPDDPVSARGDRPIVTAAWYLQPERVDLIYSPSTEDAYQETKKYLWMHCGIQERRGWSLNIHNPTELTRYERIIDPLIDFLNDIKNHVSKEDSNAEFHIVESGIPAMRTVLMLAAVSKVIHPAVVWHVDDPPADQARCLAELPPEERREQARQRMVEVDLRRFEGAALRFFRSVRLHLQVIRSNRGEEEIHCEVDGHPLVKHDPKGGPMRFLLELCKARKGEKYNVSQHGGWIRPRRLQDGNTPSVRSQARASINKEVASLPLGDRSIKELIQVRGSTRNREYRVSLEPHEIYIEE